MSSQAPEVVAHGCGCHTLAHPDIDAISCLAAPLNRQAAVDALLAAANLDPNNVAALALGRDGTIIGAEVVVRRDGAVVVCDDDHARKRVELPV